MSRRLQFRLRAGAPFGAAAALPVLLLPLPGGPTQVALLVAGMLLAAAVAGAALALPWERWRPDWHALPAILYLVSVGVVREAEGGNESGLGPLALLPVIWLALHGTRRALGVTVVAVGLVYWSPILLDGGSRYPESGWRIGALLIVLAGILGFTVQRLHDQALAQGRRLAEQARTDALTGLANRRAWDAALEAALAVAARRDEPLAVALFDVDTFKAVNDAGGHAVGDALLAELARGWAGMVRAGDVLARLGGDEFAVLLPGSGDEEAAMVVERMRARAARATCSAGLAVWDRGEDGSALIRRADAALYDAKVQGRDRLCVAAAPAPAPV